MQWVKKLSTAARRSACAPKVELWSVSRYVSLLTLERAESSGISRVKKKWLPRNHVAPLFSVPPVQVCLLVHPANLTSIPGLRCGNLFRDLRWSHDLQIHSEHKVIRSNESYRSIRPHSCIKLLDSIFFTSEISLIHLSALVNAWICILRS